MSAADEFPADRPDEFAGLPADPFGDRPMPPPDLFDAGGLPTGAPGRQLWESMLRYLEGGVDADGWDQQPTLFAVSTAQATAAALSRQGVDDVAALFTEDGDVPDGSFAAGYGVARLGELDGPPVEALWGYTAPEEAAALVLCFEAWTYPVGGSGGHDGPPSTHPGRRELRDTLAVTRAGQCYLLQRIRGDGEPQFVAPDAEESLGLLPAVLARALGAPVTAAGISPAQLLGRTVLTNVANLAGLTDPAAVLRGAPQHAQQLAGLVGERLAGLPAADREQARIALLMSTALRAVATHAAAVTAGGTRGIPAELREPLARAAAGEPVDDLTCLRLFAAIRDVTAALSWEQLAGTAFAAALPEELTEDVAWAGEQLAGAFAASRVGTATGDLLEIVAEHAPPRCPQLLSRMLAQMGWLEDDARTGTPDA